MRDFRRRVAAAGAALSILVASVGCSPPSSGNDPTSNRAATAGSADALGGMDALIAAARAEGKLNTVSMAPDWANYAAIVAGFEKKYGIEINGTNPQGSTQDEINAVKRLAGTDRGPDVLDLGVREIQDTSLFAPYKVTTWNDIPADRKDASGLYAQDYGGYMSIGYDSSKVPVIDSVTDLLKPDFNGKIALFADPTASNSALTAVMMAALATGGSLDAIGKGVDLFSDLKKNGNFVPVAATTATVENGTTPVVLNWDYLAVSFKRENPNWKLFIPADALLEGDYYGAIPKQAPHPAAARLWMEYLYSDEGQNLLLAGGARPVRMTAMTSARTIDSAAAADLPVVTTPGRTLSLEQADAAKSYLVANWARAIS